MPRAPRIWFPGAWYHLIARGDNREPIFRAEQDRHVYLRLIRSRLRDHAARLHAYVLMSNHVHLMLETGDQHIAPMIQELHGAYARYVNRRYERVGHVFEGRYRGILVERDTYALELSRYIHLNPVRAKMVEDPLAYPWSSFRAYVERNTANLVTTDVILGLVDPDPQRAPGLYAWFVRDGLRRPSPHHFEQPRRRILGSPTFVSNARRTLWKTAEKGA